jgi:pimeloyl-ACP methyl ester carboxylesterase
MKHLVLFWGWTQNDQTYKSFVLKAPKDWQIHHVSYVTLMPGGDRAHFLENTIKFFKEQKLSKAYIAGHSMGGALGLEFAFHFPEMVEHLHHILGRKRLFNSC